jgi:uncharacterized membrane protein
MRKIKEHIKEYKIIFAIGIMFLIAGVGCIILDFLFPSGDLIDELILGAVGVFFLVVGLGFIFLGVTGGI